MNGPTLPRVLIDSNRRTLLEFERGRIYSRVVDPHYACAVQIHRIPLAQIDRGYSELGCDPETLNRFAAVWLQSHRPKTERAALILQEVQKMTLPQLDVKTASNPELIAFYNANLPEGAKPVKKFSDRATAQKRVAAILDARKKDLPQISRMGNDENDITAKPKENDMSKKSTKSTKSTKPAAETDRSATTAKSWKNKAVSAARSIKHKVKVGGVEYRSTGEAFTKLKLPMSKCIAFRKVLKEKGRAVFEGHTFTLVPHEA